MPIPALLAAAPGLIQAGASLFGGGKRRREQRAAQQQFDADTNALRNFQFTNPYANLENTAEDLTVNQQAAQFQAQQTDENLSQGLDAIVAGGGGGGDAQSIAAAALQASQGASATIAQQEQSNQQLRAQQAASNQSLEAQGQATLQNQQQSQLQQFQGQSGQRLGAANAARQQATSALTSGLGSALGGFAGAGGFGGAAGGAASAATGGAGAGVSQLDQLAASIPTPNIQPNFDQYNQAQNTRGRIQGVSAFNRNSPLQRDKAPLTPEQRFEALKKYGFKEGTKGVYSKGGKKYRVNPRGEFITASGAIDPRGEEFASKYYSKFASDMFEREQRLLGNRPTDARVGTDQLSDIYTQQAVERGLSPDRVTSAASDYHRRTSAGNLVGNVPTTRKKPPFIRTKWMGGVSKN